MLENGIFISGETVGLILFIGWGLICFGIGVVAQKLDERQKNK